MSPGIPRVDSAEELYHRMYSVYSRFNTKVPDSSPISLDGLPWGRGFNGVLFLTVASQEGAKAGSTGC